MQSSVDDEVETDTASNGKPKIVTNTAGHEVQGLIRRRSDRRCHSNPDRFP